MKEPLRNLTGIVISALQDLGSKDLFEQQKDIDYLDIPSFLRTQAD